MSAVFKSIPKTTKKWEIPSSVVAVTVEKETWPAQLASEYTPDSMKITEYFKKGTQPTEVSQRYAKLPAVTNLKSTKEGKQTTKFSLKRAFPMFILYFVIAAIITTVCVHMGVDAGVFQPIKELSKFMIIMAMAAIGLNSNVIQLIKTGGKPIIVGASCWCGITVVSLIMQHVMKIW